MAWLGVVFAVTLSPHNTATQAQGDRAVAAAKKQVDLPGRVPPQVRQRETDLAGNVLLFIPLGFLAVLAFPERRAAVAVAGPLLSGAIETSQWLFLPHRTASVADVATNSTGHLAGMLAALMALVAFRRGLQPRRSDDPAPAIADHQRRR